MNELKIESKTEGETETCRFVYFGMSELKVINANGTFCKQFHLTLPTIRRRFGYATHETVLGILSIIGNACYLLIAISFNKLLMDGAG